MKRLNKKGFTLIELLAVIVILGVLLAIAVPAVTKYINSSKKSTFISNVKQYADSARTEALAGTYQFPVSQNHATVIPFSVIYPSLEKGGKTSSYDAEWNQDKSFVVIVNAGTSEAPKYEYYISAVDQKGYGIGILNSTTNVATAACVEYNELKDANVVQLGTSGGIDLPTLEITINSKKITIDKTYMPTLKNPVDG